MTADGRPRGRALATGHVRVLPLSCARRAVGFVPGDASPKNKGGVDVGFIKARRSHFYYEEKGEGPPILLIHPAGLRLPRGEGAMAARRSKDSARPEGDEDVRDSRAHVPPG